MNDEDRAILAYAKRALDDPGLDDEVQYDAAFGAECQLRAHLPRGQHGDRPEPLTCERDRVQQLIRLGYLSRRNPYVKITPAGVAALTGA